MSYMSLQWNSNPGLLWFRLSLLLAWIILAANGPTETWRNQHTDIQKLPEPWSKKWSCMTHDMAASNSASKSIQINSNELPWLSFTIPLTKTWTLASFWSSDPLGCPRVWASWQKKSRELTTVLNTLMSFALRAPCPGANDKDYIVGVNMCQPSKIHPGVLL